MMVHIHIIHLRHQVIYVNYKNMAYPNHNCMQISIWVHNRDVDQLFDFLNDRVKEPPAYWTQPYLVPLSLSGGYLIVTLNFGLFQKLREAKEQENGDFI